MSDQAGIRSRPRFYAYYSYLQAHTSAQVSWNMKTVGGKELDKTQQEMSRSKNHKNHIN